MSVCEDESAAPDLRRQAIDWLVLLRSDSLNEDEMYAFADWLSRDNRHPEAFAAAEDLFDNMLIAADCTKNGIANLISTDQPSKVIKTNGGQQIQPLKRRVRLLDISLALAAAWLFAVILIMPPQSHPLADYFSDFHTATGEFKEVELNDGSHLLLNTNSAISVGFNDALRQITLHHGQVRFTIAHDQKRPFEVKVGDLKVRALGTVFEVYSMNADDSNVLVQEHAVSVRLEDGGNTRQYSEVRIEQGQQLQHRHGTALKQPEPVILEQATAWQNHRLIINDRPLNELITELNRYRNGRIFLADADLQALRISGVFSLDHPDNTLDKIQTVLGLKQTRLGDWWVILHQ